MDSHQVAEAAKVVGWVAQHASAAEDQFPQREQMATLLRIAQSYLLEYAIHVSGGRTPIEAVNATALADLGLGEDDLQPRWR